MAVALGTYGQSSDSPSRVCYSITEIGNERALKEAYTAKLAGELQYTVDGVNGWVLVELYREAALLPSRKFGPYSFTLDLWDIVSLGTDDLLYRVEWCFGGALSYCDPAACRWGLQPRTKAAGIYRQQRAHHLNEFTVDPAQFPGCLQLVQPVRVVPTMATPLPVAPTAAEQRPAKNRWGLSLRHK